jgi:hypothetical protein
VFQEPRFGDGGLDSAEFVRAGLSVAEVLDSDGFIHSDIPSVSCQLRKSVLSRTIAPGVLHLPSFTRRHA